MGLLSQIFSPLERLKGILQNPIYHPEGDVWNHTMMVIDELAKLRDKSKYPLALMLAGVCHDFGKITTTKVENGKVTAYSHEDELYFTEEFLKSLTNDKDLIESVKILVRNHMRPNMISFSSEKAVRKLIVDSKSKYVDIDDLLLLSEADHKGRAIADKDYSEVKEWFTNKISECCSGGNSIKPLITGKDLISLGIKPGICMGELLKKAFELQIEGWSKDDIISKLLK